MGASLGYTPRYVYTLTSETQDIVGASLGYTPRYVYTLTSEMQDIVGASLGYTPRYVYTLTSEMQDIVGASLGYTPRYVYTLTSEMQDIVGASLSMGILSLNRTSFPVSIGPRSQSHGCMASKQADTRKSIYTLVWGLPPITHSRI